MALTAKIRAHICETRYLNVFFALCFLAAQLLPSGLAMAASVAQFNYMVICTADGFKKVPMSNVMSDLGLLEAGSGQPDTDIPKSEDCPACILICANGVADIAPHTAIVRMSQIPPRGLVLDDRPVTGFVLRSGHQAAPRAPPHAL